MARWWCFPDKWFDFRSWKVRDETKRINQKEFKEAYLRWLTVKRCLGNSSSNQYSTSMTAKEQLVTDSLWKEELKLLNKENSQNMIKVLFVNLTQTGFILRLSLKIRVSNVDWVFEVERNRKLTENLFTGSWHFYLLRNFN